MTTLTRRSIDAAINDIDSRRQIAYGAADDIREMCIDDDGSINTEMHNAMIDTINALDAIAAIYDEAYRAAVDQGNALKANDAL